MRILLLLAFMLCSAPASAWCWWYPFHDSPSNLPVDDVHLTASFDAVELDTSVAIGEVMAPELLLTVRSRPDGAVRCNVNSPSEHASLRPQNSASTYDIGIQGVGMRLRYDMGGVLPWAFTMGAIPGGTYFAEHMLRISFVKTGPMVGSGSLPTGELFRTRVLSPNPELVRRYMLDAPVGVVPVRPTCALVRDAIPVVFRTISSDPTAIPLASEPLAIDLLCSGGTPGERVPVSVTMTDASNPGNTSTILGLSADSEARGLGLRMLFRGAPIAFGAPGGGVGNPARWSAGSTTQGAYSIPLVAELVAMGSITYGELRAQANFLIDYL